MLNNHSSFLSQVRTKVSDLLRPSSTSAMAPEMFGGGGDPAAELAQTVMAWTSHVKALKQIDKELDAAAIERMQDIWKDVERQLQQVKDDHRASREALRTELKEADQYLSKLRALRRAPETTQTEGTPVPEDLNAAIRDINSKFALMQREGISSIRAAEGL